MHHNENAMISERSEMTRFQVKLPARTPTMKKKEEKKYARRAQPPTVKKD